MLKYFPVRFANSQVSLERQPEDVNDEVLLSDPTADVEGGNGHMVDDNRLAIALNDLRSESDEAHLSNHNLISNSSLKDHILASTVGGPSSPSGAHQLDHSQPLWPLPRKGEAFLLQYFATELALWVCFPH